MATKIKYPNRRARVIFKETYGMHDSVTALYEAAMDGEKEEALQLITELNKKLKDFRTNIIDNG